MKKKIIIGIGIIILFIVFILLTQKPSSTPQQIPPSVVPTAIIIPTSQASNTELQLVNINPPEDPTGEKKYGVPQQITFYFNKDVNLSTIKPIITPFKAVSVFEGNSFKEVRIFPVPPDFWQPNVVYTITIPKGIAASDGTILKQDIIYKIKTTLDNGKEE